MMPRASIHTTTTLSAGMIEALQSASRGESSRHCTDRSEHGGRSYTFQSLIDRGLITEDNQITERGRAALFPFSGGVSPNDKEGGK